MTMPTLFTVHRSPTGGGTPVGRPDNDDAESAALWTSIAEAATDGPQAEGASSVDAPDDGDRSSATGAPFDLPAFLQVLPKSGAAVAVAAGRDPGMAEAVRRLPPRDMPADASVSSRPMALQEGASLRLPAFLMTATGASSAKDPSFADAPVEAVSTVAQLGAVAALRGALQSMMPLRQPVASTGTVARNAGTAGEGALDESVAAKASPVVTALRGSDARATDPLRPTDRRAAANASPVAPAPSNGTATAPTVQGPNAALTAPVTFDLSGMAAISSSAMTASSDRSAGAAELGIGPGIGEGLLRAPVGSEAWQDQLGAQLSVMATPGGEAEAVMKLAPEELGELEIRVLVRDGEASLQFGAASAEARQAIEAAQPRLRELFASQGMGVSDFSIFNTLSGNPDASRRHDEASSRGPRARAGVHEEAEVRVTRREAQGIVDLYA